MRGRAENINKVYEFKRVEKFENFERINESRKSKSQRIKWVERVQIVASEEGTK